ncbi:MAG: PQQ-dependent sugar dehydrogenase [Myxococcota bacterium]
MRKLAIGAVILVMIGFTSCSLLLPERFAVKGPILNSIFGTGIDAPEDTVVEARFQLPEGFQIELFAEGIQDGRFLQFSPGGDLLISQPREGRVLQILRDRNGDGRSDGQRVFLADLDQPHGLDFHDGHLYIGEGGAIVRVPFTESGPNTLAPAGAPVRIVEGIPSGGNHWSRSPQVGPDGFLYVNVGSSCNVCEEEDPRRAALLRYNLDGSGEEIFAAGLRNSVDFDWQPGTGRLYATDNGRDLLGDDYPPCELNHVERGEFYGWPYANGDNRPDPDFGPGNEAKIQDARTPAHDFRAHNAPLGITFLRHAATPPSLQGAALVALHGSWNRSELDGYRVVSLHWDARGEITERAFLDGFEKDGDVIGRPVDIAEGPDGAIYISDDYAGAIYRVVHDSNAMAQRSADTQGQTSLKRPADRPMAVSNPLAAFAPAARAALAAQGETLFAQNACGSCHVDAQAGPGIVVKELEGLAAKFTVPSLTKFFLTPQPPMPVFDLPEEERKALAVHLLSKYPN